MAGSILGYMGFLDHGKNVRLHMDDDHVYELAPGWDEDQTAYYGILTTVSVAPLAAADKTERAPIVVFKRHVMDAANERY